MCLSVGIGVLIAQLGNNETTYSTWRQRLTAVLSWIMSPKMLLRFTLIFMVIALVLTHSRMGNTSFFASIMITGIIALMLSRYANRATVILLISLIVIDICIVGTWFGLEKVAQRLEQTSFVTEMRDDVDMDIFPYWQDYFWTGSGLGSFYTTFPYYQGADISSLWGHAHNDYLEFAAETGIIGLLLLGFAVLLTLRVVLDAQYRRRRSLNRGMAFSVTMAISALLIHSTVDFNLQIPANTATFMLILALGWISRYLPTQKISPSTTCLPPSHLVKNLAVPSLMVVLIIFIYLAGRWGLGHFISEQAQLRMAQWPKQKEITLDEWTTTEQALIFAQQLDSSNPNILKNIGLLYSLPTRLNINLTEQTNTRQQSLDYFLESGKQRPTDYYTWTYIVFLKHRLRQYDALFLKAFEKSSLFILQKPFVQYTITNVGLATWYRLSERLQKSVIVAVEQGMKTQEKQTLALIKRYRREWVICAYSTQKTKLNTFCQQK